MDYRAFTDAAHGTQKYGDDPYPVHLQAVQDKAAEFTDNIHVLMIAYMHDLLEDTSVAHEQLRALFGFMVANSVAFLTDAPGKNRRERHLNTYWSLRQDPTALFVKLCDRWCNHQNVIDTNHTSMIQMYRKEYMEFKFALYGNMHAGTEINDWIQAMWPQLDAQYEQMSK